MQTPKNDLMFEGFLFIFIRDLKKIILLLFDFVDKKVNFVFFVFKFYFIGGRM